MTGIAGSGGPPPVPPRQLTVAVLGLGEAGRAYTVTYSLGMKKRLALALALVRALTDPAARTRALAGMRRARAELTWERTAQMTLDLYGRALAGKSHHS